MRELPPPSPEQFSPFMCAFIQFLADEYERVGHRDSWSPFKAHIALCDHDKWDHEKEEIVRLDFCVPSLTMRELALSPDPIAFWRGFIKYETKVLRNAAKFKPSSVCYAVFDVSHGLRAFIDAFPDAFPTKRTKRDSKTVCKYA